MNNKTYVYVYKCVLFSWGLIFILFHFKVVIKGEWENGQQFVFFNNIFTSTKVERLWLHKCGGKNVWLIILDKNWAFLWECNPCLQWAKIWGRFLGSCLSTYPLEECVIFTIASARACLPCWGALQLSRRLKNYGWEFTPTWDNLAILCWYSSVKE